MQIDEIIQIKLSELQSKRLLTSLIFQKKKNGFTEIKENSQKWAKVHQLIINNGFFFLQWIWKCTLKRGTDVWNHQN